MYGANEIELLTRVVISKRSRDAPIIGRLLGADGQCLIGAPLKRSTDYGDTVEMTVQRMMNVYEM